MFQLTWQEWNSLRLQIATSENENTGNEEITNLTLQIVISSGYGGQRSNKSGGRNVAAFCYPKGRSLRMTARMKLSIRA